MGDLRDIESKVNARADTLNRRLGIPSQGAPAMGQPVRTVAGRVVPAADSDGSVSNAALPSPGAMRFHSWARFALGALAAFVLFYYFPFHFQLAMIGIGIYLFQSVVYELIFSKIGRGRPRLAAGESRCVHCRRRLWLRWLLLFSCCEAVPLALVYLFILLVFS